MAYGKKTATLKSDGYIIYQGYRIKQIKNHTDYKYELCLGNVTDPKTGKIKKPRLKFRTLDEAKAMAYQKRLEVNRKGSESLNLSENKKRDAIKAAELLKGYNVSLTSAAEFFIKHNREVDQTFQITELVNRYVDHYDHLQKKDHVRERTAQDVAKYLNSFSLEFGNLNIEVITADDLDRWLDKYKPTSRENHRRITNQFLRYCIKEKKINSNPMEQTKRIRKTNKQPEIYTASDVKKVLEHATSEMTPYLALGFFAGIRPTELERLEWQDIDFELSEIKIRADVSKTKDERLVVMPDNLIHILSPYSREGKIVGDLTYNQIKKRRSQIFKTAGVDYIQDGARHTWATYHLIIYGEQETKMQMGHTVKNTLWTHYVGLARSRKKQANEYFCIKNKK